MAKIRLKGVEYPCRITMGAMIRFKHESGLDIRDVDQKDFVSVIRFMWCCVKSASNADGVQMDYDFETFADLVDAGDMTSFLDEMGSESEKKTSVRRMQCPAE